MKKNSSAMLFYTFVCNPHFTDILWHFCRQKLSRELIW